MAITAKTKEITITNQSKNKKMKTLLLGILKKYWLYITIAAIAIIVVIAVIVAVNGSNEKEPIKQETTSQVQMINDSTMIVAGITLTPAETKEERKRILQERKDRLVTEKSESRILFWKDLFWSIIKALVIAAIVYQLILKVIPRMYTAWLAKKAGGTSTTVTPPGGTPPPPAPAKTPTAATTAPVKETSSAKKIINAFVAMLIILGFVIFFTGTERVNSFLKGHGIGGIFPVSWDIGFHDNTPTKEVVKTVYVPTEPSSLISIGSNNKKTIVVKKEDEASSTSNTGDSNKEVAQAVVTGPFTPVPVPQMMN